MRLRTKEDYQALGSYLEGVISFCGYELYLSKLHLYDLTQMACNYAFERIYISMISYPLSQPPIHDIPTAYDKTL